MRSGGGSALSLNDVTSGGNDVYHLGCCTSTLGFDTATGLGSVNFGELANALAGRTR